AAGSRLVRVEEARMHGPRATGMVWPLAGAPKRRPAGPLERGPPAEFGRRAPRTRGAAQARRAKASFDLLHGAMRRIKRPPRIRLCRAAGGAPSRGSAEGASGVVHINT